MRGKNLSGLEVTPAMIHVRHATKIASEVTEWSFIPYPPQPLFIIILRRHPHRSPCFFTPLYLILFFVGPLMQFRFTCFAWLTAQHWSIFLLFSVCIAPCSSRFYSCICICIHPGFLIPQAALHRADGCNNLCMRACDSVNGDMFGFLCAWSGVGSLCLLSGFLPKSPMSTHYWNNHHFLHINTIT